MSVESLCTNCGSDKHYKTFCHYVPRKPISKRGKHAELWAAFRKNVAVPYLDRRYGHVCSIKGCVVTTALDIDHIKPRGSAPHLRYQVTNLRWVCRPHHRQITDGKI